MKTIEDIWFSNDFQTQDVGTKMNGRSVMSPSNDRTQLLGKVSVIMGVSSQFRDRQSPLEELLHKVCLPSQISPSSNLFPDNYGQGWKRIRTYTSSLYRDRKRSYRLPCRRSRIAQFHCCQLYQDYLSLRFCIPSNNFHTTSHHSPSLSEKCNNGMLLPSYFEFQVLNLAVDRRTNHFRLSVEDIPCLDSWDVENSF